MILIFWVCVVLTTSFPHDRDITDYGSGEGDSGDHSRFDSYVISLEGSGFAEKNTSSGSGDNHEQEGSGTNLSERILEDGSGLDVGRHLDARSSIFDIYDFVDREIPLTELLEIEMGSGIKKKRQFNSSASLNPSSSTSDTSYEISLSYDDPWGESDYLSLESTMTSKFQAC